MFVWDNKCCSGISLKSCSNPSVHSWDSSCSQTSPGAQRRGRCSGCSSAVLCGSGISPGWSGDQSLPWRRISIAEGPSASDLSCSKVCEWVSVSVWVCVSLHRGARRCVCRLLLNEGETLRGESGKFLRPEWETDELVPGRLDVCGEAAGCKAVTQPRPLVAVWERCLLWAIVQTRWKRNQNKTRLRWRRWWT